MSADTKHAHKKASLNIGLPANKNEPVQLVPIDMAIVTGLGLAQPKNGFKNVSLSNARQRVCAKTLAATYPLPNFNNSAMDGYALNTKALPESGPYRLKISGRMAAGDADIESKPIKDAIRILTGARVPEKFNAVIMQEKCQVENGHVIIEQLPPEGTNIRYAGTDCQPGDCIILASTLIGPHHIALLAAQGLDRVPVIEKVRVAFFSTGSELRQPGEELNDGQIYNSNLHTLAAQLEKPFIEAVNLGTIPDDPELLGETLKHAASNADVVITTGGVSVGDEDHMPCLVRELGGEIHVMKVAIKPGKPVTIGTIGKAIYVGLPGNPVAAFINHVLIASPIIEKIAGLVPKAPQAGFVEAGFDRQSDISRQEYILARIAGYNAAGQPIVETIAKSGSASLLPLARSDGFVVIPPGKHTVIKGEPVQFLPH